MIPNLPENTPLWLTISVFVFMGVMVYLQTRNTTQIGKADATEKIGGAYDQLLENLQEQITTLKSDVADMKKELAKYRNWTARLIKQLIDNGIEPVQPPDTGELKNHL